MNQRILDSFQPTASFWRKDQEKKSEIARTVVNTRKAIKVLGDPPEINTIVGDGNCLYKVLSMEVCGNQRYHEQIRALVVDFMLQNPHQFESYVGRDIGDYILDNSFQLYTWGVDAEIYAAATLLQTTIVVYTSGNKYKQNKKKMDPTQTSILHYWNSDQPEQYLLEKHMRSFSTRC